jgi:penicillin-binding protein 1B
MKKTRKKRKSKKTKPKSRKISFLQKSGQFLKKWLYRGFSVLFVFLLAYIVYLDFQVRDKFEVHRWSLPASIYAQPTELYQGKAVSIAVLTEQLNRMGYRSVTHVDAAGQYEKRGNRLFLYSKGFVFWDGIEDSQHVVITIINENIKSIVDEDINQPVSIIRLEPEKIGQFHPNKYEDRLLLSYKDIPDKFISALVSVEDRKFFDHHGLDFLALGRAMIANIKAGKVVQGGSTLTQQLAKNFFLSRTRSYLRKFKEVIISSLIELHYDKQSILEAYCNQVFLGQEGVKSLHGFGLASQYYFSKNLKNLSTAEMALLIGMVKGASYYHPQRHPQRALKRRNIVLKQMFDQSVISETDFNVAKKTKLKIRRSKSIQRDRYSAFIRLVKDQLKQDYDDESLKTDGLKIFTTLDVDVQKMAELQVLKSMKKIERQHRLIKNKLQTAMVVVKPQEGEIVALLGSRYQNDSGFNRALNAHRPIGSLIKPAVYLTALLPAEGYTLTSMIKDETVAIELADGEIWRPKNYDRRSHGQVSFISALVHSYNLATVSLGMDLGLNKVVNSIRKLGFDKPIQLFPSLLLGSIQMSPLNVAQIYQPVASNGYYTKLRAIRSVLNSNNEALQRYPIEVVRRFPAESIAMLTQALQQVIQVGTAKSLKKYFVSTAGFAGKTGTTNDKRDSWFAGFKGNLLGVTWVGYDDNKPTKLSGATGALPVWASVMSTLIQE